MVKLSGKLLAACLAGMLLLPSGLHAAGASQTTIYVDGKPLKTAVSMQNDRQLVPVAFFRSVKASVGWSAKYRSAVVSKNGVTIGFPSGKRFADYAAGQSGQWQRDYLMTKTMNAGGSVYVPLAYTARKLGLAVRYDAGSKTTSISTSGVNKLHTQSAAETAVSLGAVSQEDLKWLYRITEAEAGGESYKGKTAVAASILNRVKSPEWPKTIKDTIFQVTKFNGVSYYQYSPVLDKRIYEVTPSRETKQAVQAALDGEDPSKGAIVFYNPDKTDNKWVRTKDVTVVIGNHVFAK
ncbi:cell wall hydrolase [Paenibacillus arenilitoris]|uniref:Cell wall hydrolase n=1 Tax=Paenibacillus arenilitoris TaxID=2772299 RepID=A0A927H702_9BACL|nr:cell wall hydrolase [Paenibacillus arenilitoris]MBD2871096.1 cell wall hydrolase [Paenibacillus arenilitoris]